MAERTGASGEGGAGDVDRASAGDAVDVSSRSPASPATAAESSSGPDRTSSAAPPLDEEARVRAQEARLRAYAHLLDSAVRLPGGFRVGLDGLVGLVPVVGDLIGVGLSGYLVVAAARLGIPRAVVARMIVNVAIEGAIGIVPIFGDAFDFYFKANERNARLLQRELDRRESARREGSGKA